MFQDSCLASSHGARVCGYVSNESLKCILKQDYIKLSFIIEMWNYSLFIATGDLDVLQRLKKEGGIASRFYCCNWTWHIGIAWWHTTQRSARNYLFTKEFINSKTFQASPAWSADHDDFLFECPEFDPSSSLLLFYSIRYHIWIQKLIKPVTTNTWWEPTFQLL